MITCLSHLSNFTSVTDTSMSSIGECILKLEVFIEHIPRAECLQDTVQLDDDVISRASLYRVYCVRV